jgi:hypothetical protein
MITTEYILNLLSNLVSGFIANFYSTLIAGTVLGIIGGYLISKKLNLEDKKARELDEEIESCQLSILFLEMLQKERKTIFNVIRKFKKEVTDYKKGYYINLPTDSWEVLKFSGNSTKVLDTDLLRNFTFFYSEVNGVNNLYNRIAIIQNSTDNAAKEALFELLLYKLNIILKYSSKEYSDALETFIRVDKRLLQISIMIRDKIQTPPDEIKTSHSFYRRMVKL